MGLSSAIGTLSGVAGMIGRQPPMRPLRPLTPGFNPDAPDYRDWLPDQPPAEAGPLDRIPMMTDPVREAPDWGASAPAPTPEAPRAPSSVRSGAPVSAPAYDSYQTAAAAAPVRPTPSRFGRIVSAAAQGLAGFYNNTPSAPARGWADSVSTRAQYGDYPERVADYQRNLDNSRQAASLELQHNAQDIHTQDLRRRWEDSDIERTLSLQSLGALPPDYTPSGTLTTSTGASLPYTLPPDALEQRARTTGHLSGVQAGAAGAETARSKYETDKKMRLQYGVDVSDLAKRIGMPQLEMRLLPEEIPGFVTRYAQATRMNAGEANRALAGDPRFRQQLLDQVDKVTAKSKDPSDQANLRSAVEAQLAAGDANGASDAVGQYVNRLNIEQQQDRTQSRVDVRFFSLPTPVVDPTANGGQGGIVYQPRGAITPGAGVPRTTYDLAGNPTTGGVPGMSTTRPPQVDAATRQSIAGVRHVIQQSGDVERMLRDPKYATLGPLFGRVKMFEISKLGGMGATPEQQRLAVALTNLIRSQVFSEAGKTLPKHELELFKIPSMDDTLEQALIKTQEGLRFMRGRLQYTMETLTPQQQELLRQSEIAAQAGSASGGPGGVAARGAGNETSTATVAPRLPPGQSPTSPTSPTPPQTTPVRRRRWNPQTRRLE